MSGMRDDCPCDADGERDLRGLYVRDERGMKKCRNTPAFSFKKHE